MAVPGFRVRSSLHGCEYDREDDLSAGLGYIPNDLDIMLIQPVALSV
jgi:hypothetical protein